MLAQANDRHEALWTCCIIVKAAQPAPLVSGSLPSVASGEDRAEGCSSQHEREQPTFHHVLAPRDDVANMLPEYAVLLPRTL